MQVSNAEKQFRLSQIRLKSAVARYKSVVRKHERSGSAGSDADEQDLQEAEIRLAHAEALRVQAFHALLEGLAQTGGPRNRRRLELWNGLRAWEREQEPYEVGRQHPESERDGT
jgi:hypothetical protein